MKRLSPDATPRQVMDAAQTEAEFQAAVVDLAKLLGWHMYHVPDSRRATEAGFPDWVFLLPGRTGVLGQLVFAELKTETGRARPEQQAWIAGLQTVPGITAGVFRPSDWPGLARLLRAGR